MTALLISLVHFILAVLELRHGFSCSARDSVTGVVPSQVWVPDTPFSWFGLFIIIIAYIWRVVLAGKIRPSSVACYGRQGLYCMWSPLTRSDPLQLYDPTVIHPSARYTPWIGYRNPDLGG